MILFRTQVFGSMHFLLPKSMCSLVERLRRNFYGYDLRFAGTPINSTLSSRPGQLLSISFGRKEIVVLSRELIYPPLRRLIKLHLELVLKPHSLDQFNSLI